MFSNLRQGRQKYGLRRYVRRQIKAKFNQVFFRSDRDDLISAFRDLGARQGMTLCVHSSLSRLGYIHGGADTIIDALQAVVGEVGCVMMPAFSMSGDMESYVRNAAPFDVQHTPSLVGQVPEIFRRRPEVIRSHHPTNSVSAWGDNAALLLEDHDRSLTPFGPDTPYGRLAEQDDAYVLMLDTHLHSLLHHLQERVAFPNLFVDAEAELELIDESGSKRSMRTRVMRRRTPYFVAIDGSEPGEPDWAILHDYALLFPSRRLKEARQLGYSFSGFPPIRNRRRELEAAGILRSGRLGPGEIGLLKVRPFLDRIQPEFEDLIERYREAYDVRDIEARNLPYS